MTDTGHLLRGAIWDTTGYAFNKAPDDASQFIALKARGINAVHLYAEAYQPVPHPGSTPFPGVSPYPAGARALEVDKMVKYTRDNGLYLIILVATPYTPFFSGYDLYNPDFAKQFWSFYAPRYANETHVIFEIQNEPYGTYSSGVPSGQSGPSPSTLLTFEKDAYTIIRRSAPNTPVLLFSYAFFRTQQGIISDLRWINSNVLGLPAATTDPSVINSTWTNAKVAVALHGYSGVSATSAILTAVLGSGFPCVVTEFVDNSHYPPPIQDVAETIAFEDQKVSWLTFLLPSSITDPANDVQFKTPLEQAGVVWVAENGSWPASSSPPVGAQIGLNSVFNGKWITTGTNPTADALIASRDAIVNSTEKFVVTSVVPAPYFVGLKSQGASSGSVNKFADADSGTSYVVPERNFASSAKLEWMNLSDGSIALKAYSNNKFFSLDGSGQLIANQPTVTRTGHFIFKITP